MGFAGPVRKLERANSGLGSNNNNNNKRARYGLQREDSGVSSEATPPLSDLSRLSPRSMAKAMNKALLHNSCRLFPDQPTVIQCALQFDPSSIRQEDPTEFHAAGGSTAGSVTSSSQASSSSSEEVLNEQSSSNSQGGGGGATDPRAPETYKYAINIALKNNATPEVVELLAATAPDVLILPDGPEQCGSLSIFLMQIKYSMGSGTDQQQQQKEANSQIVRCLLRHCRSCASILDRHQNAPLHYAVRAARHLPLPTVALVHAAFPQALQQRNFHGETALEVAVKLSSSVPVTVVDFLQKLLYDKLEGDSVHALDALEEDDLDLSRRQQEYGQLLQLQVELKQKQHDHNDNHFFF